ncbi:MAG: reactive intermediate/imine deaminase [Chloroflexi bacterium 13_1_40CM_4_68_4]|jgi:2-iminobutanoate/2-iminopropanoate deaminase|nr:MAG: reactive intermediate/imine deaminase [Chloroflexi bacterium 13_1_40CM_4_68_4]
MAELRSVSSEKAPKALGPYSQAIVTGDLVFCAGQVGLDPATGQVVSGDIKDQTRRCLDNLAAVLEAAGSSLDRVTKTTVFLTDLAEFTAMNEAYAERFGGHKPARSTIGIAALPRGARIEIECIAIRR